MTTNDEGLAPDEDAAMVAYVERLYEALTPLYSPEDLDALPDGSVVITEMTPGAPEPVYKTGGAWSGLTGLPTLPALLLVRGGQIVITRPRRSARSTDPDSSHRPERARRMGWDSCRMRALRIFYGNSLEPMTYYQVQVQAENTWGPGRLGESPWKRCSELHTDYEPPLIEQVCDDQGVPIEVPGKHGDLVNAYRITDAGRAMVRRSEPTA